MLFKTSLGVNYLKVAAPIFLLSYIIGPLTSVLQAINKSKLLMKINLISNIIKIVVLILLTSLNISMFPLLIAYFAQYLFMIIYQLIVIKKVL